jgi:hypothetical protein
MVHSGRVMGNGKPGLSQITGRRPAAPEKAKVRQRCEYAVIHPQPFGRFPLHHNVALGGAAAAPHSVAPTVE